MNREVLNEGPLTTERVFSSGTLVLVGRQWTDDEDGVVLVGLRFDRLSVPPQVPEVLETLSDPTRSRNPSTPSSHPPTPGPVGDLSGETTVGSPPVEDPNPRPEECYRVPPGLSGEQIHAWTSGKDALNVCPERPEIT